MPPTFTINLTPASRCSADAGDRERLCDFRATSTRLDRDADLCAEAC